MTLTGVATDPHHVPCTYQKITGTLNPGAHAGSYNGQDAYNDMLVTFCQQRSDEYKESSVASCIASRDYKSETDLVCFGQGSFGQYKEGFSTLKANGGDIGGGQRNPCDTVGALCARDYKGVGSQYVDEGKVIVQENGSP